VQEKEISAPAATDEDRLSYRRARGGAFLIGIIGLLAVGAGFVGLWFFATTSIRENFRHHLVTLANVAAMQVDPELHRNIRAGVPLNGPQYALAVAPLRRLRAASRDIRFVYTTVLEGDTVRFVLDAEDPGAKDESGAQVQANIGDVDPTCSPC